MKKKFPRISETITALCGHGGGKKIAGVLPKNHRHTQGREKKKERKQQFSYFFFCHPWHLNRQETPLMVNRNPVFRGNMLQRANQARKFFLSFPVHFFFWAGFVQCIDTFVIHFVGTGEFGGNRWANSSLFDDEQCVTSFDFLHLDIRVNCSTHPDTLGFVCSHNVSSFYFTLKSSEVSRKINWENTKHRLFKVRFSQCVKISGKYSMFFLI